VSDLLLLEIAMYRSWIIEQRGYDLANTEVEELLGATHASARLGMETARLIELLDASMQPEQRATLRSLRAKTRFDERLKRRPTDHNGPDIA
jgi:predicted nucleotidyltransferase